MLITGRKRVARLSSALPDHRQILRGGLPGHYHQGGDPSLQIASPKILTFIEKNPTLKKVGFFRFFFRKNQTVFTLRDIYVKREIMDTFFDTREAEGRIAYLNLNLADIVKGKKTIHFTEDKYEVYDFEQTAWTTSVESYGEIKTVHRPFRDYNDFQIDYNKVKKLQTLSQTEGRRGYIVGFFRECAVVWDITDMDLEGRRRDVNCTVTTADYGKKRVKTEIGLTEKDAIYVKDYDGQDNKN